MDEPSPDNSEISGFYGPGAWAAWVILLVSSWIPIFLNDYESNTHFIASALYTNWAAIDLLRHLRPLGPGEYLERGDPLEPVIDAPGAVLFIGTTHSLLQGTVCFFKLSSVAAGDRRKLRKRLVIIHIGLLLPLSASFYGYFTAFHVVAYGFMVLCVFESIVLLLYAAVQPRLPHFVRRFPPQKYRAAIPLACLVVFSVACMFRVVNLLLFGTLIYHDGPSMQSLLIDRCHYVPCAPQQINEWDQNFSLLVALALLFYEFKTGIFSLLGKFWEALRNWCTSKFQSSF